MGLIRAAAGYRKHASGHWAKMLALGLEKLSALPATCGGVRLEEPKRREDLANAEGIRERLRQKPPRLTLIPDRSA